MRALCENKIDNQFLIKLHAAMIYSDLPNILAEDKEMKHIKKLLNKDRITQILMMLDNQDSMKYLLAAQFLSMYHKHETKIIKEYYILYDEFAVNLMDIMYASTKDKRLSAMANEDFTNLVSLALIPVHETDGPTSHKDFTKELNLIYYR